MTPFSPAFPTFPTSTEKGNEGMTLRHYFAAAAMHGLLASKYSPGEVAKTAVKIADALLEELGVSDAGPAEANPSKCAEGIIASKQRMVK